jgi:type I restriction enzyme S subunit
MIETDWEIKQLNDICRNISTNNKRIKQKNYQNNAELPVIDQGEDLIGGYTNEGSSKIDCKLPAIIFGDHTRAVKFVNFEFAPGADGIKVLEPKKNINPKFLYYLLKKMVFEIPNKGYARHFQYLCKENYPVPPLPTQNHIVEKIEELFSDLDHGVENLEKAQQQLKAYRQAVLKDAFEGKLTKEWREQQDDLPTPEELIEQIKAERKAHRERELAEWEKKVEQWEKDGKNGKKPYKPKTHKIETTLKKINSSLNESNITCLVSLEHIKSYSIYGPRYSSKEYEDVGVAVLRTSDISEGGKVDWKNAPKIPLTDYDLNKYKLEKGDLLITRTGSIGTISVFDDEVKAIPGAFLIHYRLITDFVNPWYVYYFLRTNKAQNHFKEKSAGVGRPNLNVPSIEELLIPLPSIQEQNIVVQEIESRLSVVDQLEQTINENLQKAEGLRQSILKKAFNGNLIKYVQ